MSDPELRRVPRVIELLRSADLSRAYTLCVFAAVLGAHLISRLSGTVTLVTVIAGLCVLGIAILAARRREFSLPRLVPLTLLALVAWALISMSWSIDVTAALSGWVSLCAIAVLAVTIGHVRDTLQTVRALGDVCRVALGASLALEILSGVLFDTPLDFLGIQGRLAELGPVQGVFGTRNMLGFVAVVALITFAIELRTQSVRRGVAVLSLTLAGALALLSASPTVYVLAAAVLLAAAALAIVRAVPAHRRRAVQWLLAGVVVAVGLTLVILQRRILDLLGARDDLALRSELWTQVNYYVRMRPVQGWGWIGAWDRDVPPYYTLNFLLQESHGSALNAFVDVLLQIGWVGLVLFVAMIATAVVRSWLVAADRRSVVYAWTPLMLVTLVAVSLFESFTLVGTGWLLLVICVVRAGQSRSWRDRVDPRPPTGTLPTIG
ncbi:O-antigen ligase family protein [Microbacterium sp. No. 7]|uniref:O-antigen ligase family protein n=1 Tax=Microbacterium sp. No. 7 TaxID=1714373 RepID=UPI0006D1E481|nr:O-antigen ligase family protein [Microbacterium sp. No. 7]ALJ19402.1 lipid A core--O-antigen ligase [Microbacterium sp. No. 7]